MFIGKLNTDDTAATAIAADHSYGQQFSVPDDRLVAKVAAYLDGLAGGHGTALVKAVIYDSALAIVATSDEVAVNSGDAAAWLTFRFDTPPAVASGNIEWALIVGGDAGIVQAYAQATGTVPGKVVSDTYSDGPATPFPTLTTVAPIAMYADVFEAYAPPTNELEVYYARLPFHEAQAKLGETSPVKGTARPVSVTWHGTKLDPERGSFAVLRAGGDFDPTLIGERVKISYIRSGVVRVIYAFVHNVGDLDVRDEISVTRRLWMELEAAGFDRIDATVEQLA